MQNTKRPRQVWGIQHLSRALLSVFNTSLCCLVSCPFLRVFCDSFSLWLFVYVRKNVWILAFVLGSTSLSLGCLIQGVTSNFYWVILFFPGEKPPKNSVQIMKISYVWTTKLNKGDSDSMSETCARAHLCMCKDRLAVKQLLQSGDTQPCFPSSLSNYWSKPGQKPPLFLSLDGMTELYPLSLSPSFTLAHTHTHTRARPPVLLSRGAPASLLSRPAQLLSKELSSFLPES